MSSDEQSTSPDPKPAAPPAAAPAPLSTLRKSTLLLIFCLAQFLDVFNFGAIIIAIPHIQRDRGFPTADSIWVISAFQLTFAAFLLLSGRISDVYDPKHCFIAGAVLLGALAIGCGFVHSYVGLFVLRALQGIGASLTIPSAFGLIMRFFPGPKEQGLAIAAFVASGGVGTTLGIIIGALFVQFTRWEWVFWFSSCTALPLALVSALVIPSQSGARRKATARSLDIVGVSILTAALVLFIFAVTSGSITGWGTARVLAPLIISLFMVAAFLYWETLITPEHASLPPRMWFFPNFALIFITALSPYLFWTTIYVLFTSYWQQTFGWSALSTATHFLPIAIPSLICSLAGGALVRIIPAKHVILLGGILAIAATALLPFGGREDHYWRIIFPGFILGSSGATLVLVGGNVAIFQNTPPSYAATVGAIFNAALQLGAAVGSSAITSIQSNVNRRRAGSGDAYAGTSAGLWFLFAVFVLESVAVAVGYRTGGAGAGDGEGAGAGEAGAGEKVRGREGADVADAA